MVSEDRPSGEMTYREAVGGIRGWRRAAGRGKLEVLGEGGVSSGRGRSILERFMVTCGSLPLTTEYSCDGVALREDTGGWRG